MSPLISSTARLTTFMLTLMSCNDPSCSVRQLWNPFDPCYDISPDELEESGFVVSYEGHVCMVHTNDSVEVKFWIGGEVLPDGQLTDDSYILGGEYFLPLETLDSNSVAEKAKMYDAFPLSSICSVGVDDVVFVQHRVSNIIFRCFLSHQRSGLLVPHVRPFISIQDKERRIRNRAAMDSLHTFDIDYLSPRD